MNYKRLGSAGLKVSELSLGSWVTYSNQVGLDAARECMAAARDAGVSGFIKKPISANRTPTALLTRILACPAPVVRTSRPTQSIAYGTA